MHRLSYEFTLTACFTGYITQAIVVNFLPLLFITFSTSYNIPLEKITLLIAFSFILQLATDVVSTKLIDKIGYRRAIIIANLCAVIGLVLLSFLPELIDPFIALIISVFLCAIGSGLEEVLISPMVEACPTKRKSAIMSLTHSFYCWGTVAVIGLSTLFFVTVGLDKWKQLALLWAIVPVFNAIFFIFVSIYNKKETSEHGFKSFIKNKAVWVLALLMVCAGAAEQAMTQWASAFAESALGVEKTIGDMAGACLFVFCMAISRTLYAVISEKIKLEKFMIVSAALCVFAYAGAVFSPYAWMSLVSCGLVGLSVGIMWPGTISISTKTITSGGTAMFAFLAMFGDVGCTLGPSLVGFVAGAIDNNLKSGLAFAIIFPLILILGVLWIIKINKKNKTQLLSRLDEKE